jgi:hypothetical protein
MSKINNKKDLIQMKNKFILDPLWITQGNFLDAEYFNYVLLAASLKYKEEIETDNIDRFSEVLFHILNLNNLAVNGALLTPKFKEIYDEPRVKQIREDLKKIYELSEDTADIFKNANFVFLNLLLEYMQIELDILNKLKIFYMNSFIHVEKEIFIVTNFSGNKKYTIWKLKNDPKLDFGYSFSRITSVNLPELKENALIEEIEKLEDPKLQTISGKKNLIFAVILEKEDERKVAKTIKDTLLLNRGIAKGYKFEPLIITDLYKHIWFEKMMPFTLDQWK